MESGIPVTPHNGRPFGPTWGWFVKLNDSDIRLCCRDGNTWPLDQVTILHGGFGFDDEGIVKLPRPAEYDASGNEVVLGDRGLILFAEGSRRRPVFVAGFRRIQASAGDFLPYNHNSPSPGADPNRWAARIQPHGRDGPVGSVDIEAGYDGTAGLRISVGAPDGSSDATRTKVEILQDLFELRKGKKEASNLLRSGSLSDGFFADLLEVMTALVGLGCGPAATMVTKITAELSAPGTSGYTSNVGKST